MPQPTAERTVELAWRTEAPSWTTELQFRASSYWARVCQRALAWQAAGLSEEQMEAELTAATALERARQRAFAASLQANQSPEAKQQRSLRTAELLEEL